MRCNHSYDSISWVCNLHFSLKMPESLYSFRGGCASHRALFTAGGREGCLEGVCWDGFQVLSEVCLRLLGGAGAEPSAQAGGVWLRQGIALSPPAWAQW